MRSSKPFVLLGLLSGIIPSAAQTAPGLFDALRSAGASQFAQFIQSDPGLLATFTSSAVGTVFAPRDGAVPASTRRRATNTTQEQQLDLSACHGIQSCSQMNKPPGAVISSSDNSANIGSSQNVITKTSAGSSCGSKKRWLHGRQANGTTPSLVEITCGLGNVVNILDTDIPYNGGVIHLVDNYFTVPETVSATAQALGLNTFSSLASSANLTDDLNNTPSITVFIPSDAAFAAGLSTPTANTANLIERHIVPNFLGYLPNLQNGATLVTQAGTPLTVTVQGDNFYINGALITKPNIITENGVVHVINQVLGTTTTATTSSAPLTSQMGMTGAISVACAIVSLFAFSMA